MVLSIKDEQTDEIVRRLATLKNCSITEAVRESVARQLQELQSTEGVELAKRREIIQRYIDRGRTRREKDVRSADEILGYDEFGLPS